MTGLASTIVGLRQEDRRLHEMVSMLTTTVELLQKQMDRLDADKVSRIDLLNLRSTSVIP